MSMGSLGGSLKLTYTILPGRLAHMIAKVEALQAWLEAVTFQMCNMTYNETSEYLAGQISFLKMQCTISAGEIASDAMMVFGGRSLTKTGMGRHIQHFHQTQVSRQGFGCLGVWVFGLVLCKRLTGGVLLGFCRNSMRFWEVPKISWETWESEWRECLSGPIPWCAGRLTRN